MVRSLFAPHVQRFVEVVLRQGKTGVSSGTLSITSSKSGAPFHEQRPFDRFKLIIPYGGQSLTWEVIFDGEHEEHPPDFIFDDTEFLPNIEDVHSLCEWTPRDTSCLLRSVHELLDLYRKKTASQLKDFSRLQFEYSSLIHQADLTESDVEVFFNRKSRNGPVNFLIRLPVDFSKIPPVLTRENLGEDSAVLLITFQTTEGVKIIPQLYLSPRVEQSLGETSALRIPSFPNGGCLMDYVPIVTELLTRKVDQIVKGFMKRKEYIASFLSVFGRSLIEYDAESFSQITFLLEYKHFFFLFSSFLPHNFPQEKPSFIFQSVYHASLGQPYTSTCTNYPYSPRWSGSEMAERARSFILEYIPSFQWNSVTNKC
ncbi:BRISC and BRCA1-A complex member 2-like isoform X1 [Tachypleus tridentatus]|uniref:BRISC and BRCA1-A complex member 2-like isoform X1 n=1 Tax=Tachypleus tridentatus TaxID=6853 RepID=UPI003FD081F3